MRHADHVFVQSEQMKKDIQKEGIDGHLITPILMGFEPEQFALNISIDETRTQICQ